MDTVVGIVFGATPSQMSLLYFLHYLHCAGGWSVIVDSDTKGYAQEWRIEVKTVYQFSKFVLLCPGHVQMIKTAQSKLPASICLPLQ